MNHSDDLKEEIETLQCVYNKNEVRIEYDHQDSIRIIYTASLQKDTKLDIEFKIDSGDCSISVINNTNTKKNVPPEILSEIQRILREEYKKEIDSMPIFQCISFCSDELLSDERLDLVQQLEKIKLNDDIDPDKIFWAEVAKYRKEFKANGGSFINYTKLNISAASFENGVTISKEVKEILQHNNCLWKAIPSVKDVKLWAETNYDTTNVAIRFIATAQNVNRFLMHKGKRKSNQMEVVFHGTNSRNVASIIHSGLVVGGTKGVPVANGRCYGKGVYCSPKMDVAKCYARRNATGAVFVCVVRKRACNKSGQIYVVPNDNDILPIYLIQYW